MKSRTVWMLASVLAIIISQIPLHAAYTIKNGRLVDVCEVATRPVQEHFAMGAIAYDDGKWKEATHQFRIVTSNFPGTVYGQEAYFYLGVSEFYLAEYDLSNAALSEYLRCQNNPRYFQDAINYKFAIAEKFACGAKRRFFGTKKLPKWIEGKELAIEIFDEVIAAVPAHEIAAQSLMSKGYLQWELGDYRGSIESFQLVIRRFPKHELAPECYVLISHVYVDQSQYEYQNPDILAFAEINLIRFQKDFPREARIVELEADLAEIKEIYANGLYQTGQFYERTLHPRAAIIYYYNAIHQFPDTCIGELCRERLQCLDKNYCDPYEGDEDDSPEEIQEEEFPRAGETIERTTQLMGA